MKICVTVKRQVSFSDSEVHLICAYLLDCVEDPNLSGKDCVFIYSTVRALSKHPSSVDFDVDQIKKMKDLCQNNICEKPEYDKIREKFFLSYFQNY